MCICVRVCVWVSVCVCACVRVVHVVILVWTLSTYTGVYTVSCKTCISNSEWSLSQCTCFFHYICIVRCFELQGRHFKTVHHYYYYYQTIMFQERSHGQLFISFMQLAQTPFAASAYQSVPQSMSVSVCVCAPEALLSKCVSASVCVCAFEALLSKRVSVSVCVCVSVCLCIWSFVV